MQNSNDVSPRPDPTGGMKILVTASTLPRRHGDAVPAFVLDQCTAISRIRPDIKFLLLAPHDAGAARQENLDGLTVQRFRYCWPESLQQLVYPAIIPNLRRRPWLWLQVPLLFAAEFAAIFAAARSFRPDVIYSHWFTPQAIAGGLVASLLNIPHVFTSHSSDVQVLGRLPVIGPWLVRAVTRRVHACTAVSERTKSKLRAFFSDSEWRALRGRVDVIPMGVTVSPPTEPSPESRATARQVLRLGDETAILFIGRLTAKKGLSDLLEAAAGLAADGLPFRLLIAGDGELRPEVEQQIDRLQIGEFVQMLGYVTGAQKQQCTDAADVLVVPSIITPDLDAEGLPVSLLEGLAAGKICVATDLSGAEEILTDGEDGILVPGGNPPRLAEALRRAATLSEGSRLDMAARARERARDFDWGTVAARYYEHLFTGLAANP